MIFQVGDRVALRNGQGREVGVITELRLMNRAVVRTNNGDFIVNRVKLEKA